MRNWALLEAIDRKNWTQGHLARTVGICEVKMTRIIRGYRKPDLSDIEKICAALAVKPEEIGFSDEDRSIQP